MAANRKKKMFGGAVFIILHSKAYENLVKVYAKATQ